MHLKKLPSQICIGIAGVYNVYAPHPTHYNIHATTSLQSIKHNTK